uniref:Uncharacterized protein n=1 Tax=Arundo donax TaxID=35708 RepID=A0A0A9TV23_ARUDO
MQAYLQHTTKHEGFALIETGLVWPGSSVAWLEIWPPNQTQPKLSCPLVLGESCSNR